MVIELIVGFGFTTAAALIVRYSIYAAQRRRYGPWAAM